MSDEEKMPSDVCNLAEGFPAELDYRGRGRPRLPDGQRRREKVIVSVTADELRRVMIKAANAPGGPMRLQDWVRKMILVE